MCCVWCWTTLFWKFTLCVRGNTFLNTSVFWDIASKRVEDCPYFYGEIFFSHFQTKNISAYKMSTPAQNQGFQLQEYPYSLLCSPFKNESILNYKFTYCWLAGFVGTLLKHWKKHNLLINVMNLQWLEMYFVERMASVRPFSASDWHIVITTKGRNELTLCFAV